MYELIKESINSDESALELAKAAREYHPQVSNLSSLEEAVEVSHLLADKDTVILCFGSLSYLGAIKKIYEKRSKRRLKD